MSEHTNELLTALESLIDDALDCSAFQEKAGCRVEASETLSRVNNARAAIAKVREGAP